MSTNTKNTYISFWLNNGKLRIESGEYNSGYSALPTRETSSSTMYKIGWNLLCFTDDGSNYKFYSYPHFTSTVLTETFSNTNHQTSNSFIGVFGAIHSGGSSFTNSFQGIINSVYIKSGAMTSAQIMSNYKLPRTANSAL